MLERLAVITPRPRINLILYHGVLAPNAAWRSRVVGSPKAGGFGDGAPRSDGATTTSAPTATDTAPEPRDREHARPHRAGSPRWADLTRRTFGFDVLACPRCGGRLRLIALIEQASVIQGILRHLGLPTDVPEPRPSRAPPLSYEAHPHSADDDLAASTPC